MSWPSCFVAILAWFFFQCALAGAVTWKEASSTTRSKRTSVTKASPVTRAASLVASHLPHFDTPSTYEPPHVCGYVDYSLYNSYTCAGINTCLWNSHLKLVGCGNPTSINYITSCVPYRSLQFCDDSCFANPSIIRCGSDIPHCRTARIGHAGNYSILNCQSTHLQSPFKIHLTYEGQTSIGHLPRYLGDDGNITYATDIPRIVIRTNASGTSTFEEMQTLYMASSSAVPSVAEAIVSSTTKREQETESCAPDADESVVYVQQQREKEIVAGSVMGSFMVLVMVVFAVGVLIAWKRKVKEEGLGKSGEGCELGEVDTGGEVRREEERRTP